MPTKRFYRLLLLTFVLYMFANQTQVGWLYVIVSLLLGVLIFSWVINRRAIQQISAVREMDLRDAYIEGERLEIGLQFSSASQLSGYQLRLDELCPVADPLGDRFLQQWYLPGLSTQRHRENEVEIIYEVELYKRGVFRFPAVEITSRFPFGLFQRSNYSEGLVAEDGLSLLVYPEIKPLSRLPLLDRQPAAEMMHPRPGSGNEFLSLRPYRYGDSPRHIHWRSVARTGRLVSKEFVDESLPGMALLIDRRKFVGVEGVGTIMAPKRGVASRPLRPLPQVRHEDGDEDADEYGQSKHTPFETAVKIGASLGDYALRHGHTLMLIDEEAPRGAVTADMLMQYLARVEPDQAKTFDEQIGRVQQTYLAVVLPHPDQEAIDGLIELKQLGHEILAILLDGSSFPNPKCRGAACCTSEGIARYAPTLQTQGIECRIVGYEDDWAELIGGRYE